MSINFRELHDWTVDPETAIGLQHQLAPNIIREGEPEHVEHIAGVDIGFEDEGATTRAVIVLMHWPSLEIVEQVIHREATRMPYVPGLLSFRELPAAIGAFKRLEGTPQLVMVDGMGIAHPRRLGIAAHLGLWLELPTIGVGKSRLCGRHEPVAEEKGARTPLVDRSETIGMVLRTRERVKPLYISTGHRIGLDNAVEWVMCCLTRYKLPEPTRQADRLASRRTRALRNDS
ncbi:deoxyribonuclease V [Kushneria phosphatilytica]|uniref:Endonuclease V n=1 Tax=Kushneria phosphatilytica TaxID=657387 RepID=A0A1S1P103_9GAMM|nr:deoxyribonuclease V [Kushneria phosphatilytica]OHV13108.1 endonuclease V [Kushneria phosphatilytica]QEL10696.1 deoxyribonuclease V [Kushneria phosphatilytica]